MHVEQDTSDVVGSSCQVEIMSVCCGKGNTPAERSRGYARLKAKQQRGG